MIRRWFARMVREAFDLELKRVEMRGYRRGREAGYHDGHNAGWDEAGLIYMRQNVPKGTRADVAAAIRGEA